MASNPNEYNRENWAALNDLSGVGDPINIGSFDTNMGDIDIFAGMNTEDDVRRVYGDDSDWFINEFRRRKGLTQEQQEDEAAARKEAGNSGISDATGLLDENSELNKLNEGLYGQDLDKNDPNYQAIIDARAAGTANGIEQGLPMAEASQMGLDAGNAAVEKAKGSNEANEAFVKEGQAQSEGAEQAQKAAETAATTGASAGINRSRTGMLGDQSSQATQTANVANNYAAARSQAASTQADYLSKMSQADALSQQSSNINKGAGLTALGGGLQMGSAGLKAGMSLFGGNK